MPEDKQNRKRSGPKKVTHRRLENIAIHYLERFSSSVENLRRVLQRRVEQAARVHETDREEASAWIETVIGKCKSLGYVDDRSYAQTKAGALHRQGKPPRAIGAYLSSKGVGAEDVLQALALLEEETGGDAEWTAALTYARKKRLGPYGSGERKDKELASLGRAGFSYDVARRIVEMETED